MTASFVASHMGKGADFTLSQFKSRVENGFFELLAKQPGNVGQEKSKRIAGLGVGHQKLGQLWLRGKAPPEIQ
ncbi:hypothetical protein U0C82_09435 [Fulvimarina sp. 2208YS6-2-32]|uniref:Uncharacterized protein n=1 Tax=Fulvimarina uroteuthidis TaxID=3098149 RepID=A0ABU5I2J6_9HYPH|nr:hypothetical protein [Fulvimarina sp. 2208YS6-2-32]MDY8109362.1 hypothetical protein [Fulvimarina sp. 2208YS6-2-32]